MKINSFSISSLNANDSIGDLIPVTQLQENLLNMWISYGVDQTYQNLFLVFIDSIKDAKLQYKQIEKQIRKTYQKSSLFFLLQENIQLRAEVKKELQTKIKIQTKKENYKKEGKAEIVLRQLCDQIKNLRRVNLLIAETILKMFEQFKTTKQARIGSLAKKYIELFLTMDQENQFLKQSFLNQFILFEKGYDPFFMVHYEEIMKSKNPSHLTKYKPIQELFQLNISYAYKLMRAQQKMLRYMLLVDNQRGTQRERKELINRQRLQKMAYRSKNIAQTMNNKNDQTIQYQNQNQFLRLPSLSRWQTERQNVSKVSTIKRLGNVRPDKRYRFSKLQEEEGESPDFIKKRHFSLKPIQKREFHKGVDNYRVYYTPKNAQRTQSLNRYDQQEQQQTRSLLRRSFQTEEEFIKTNSQLHFNISNSNKLKGQRQKLWNQPKMKNLRQYLKSQDFRQWKDSRNDVFQEDEIQQIQNDDESDPKQYRMRSSNIVQQQQAQPKYISLRKSQLLDEELQYIAKDNQKKKVPKTKQMQESNKIHQQFDKGRSYPLYQGGTRRGEVSESDMLQNEAQKESKKRGHISQFQRDKISNNNSKLSLKRTSVQKLNKQNGYLKHSKPQITVDQKPQIKVGQKSKGNHQHNQEIQGETSLKKPPFKDGLTKNVKKQQQMLGKDSRKKQQQMPGKHNGKKQQQMLDKDNDKKNEITTNNSVIKMIPGKLNFKDFQKYVRSKKVHSFYEKCYNQSINQFQDFVQNTQTYLTQFTLNDELVVFALCSPTASGNLIVFIWAPIDGICDQKTSAFFFKKYVDFLEKQTTSKSIAYKGRQMPELKSEKFDFLKEKSYVRKRQNAVSRQSFQFEYFFSLQASIITFKQTTDSALLYSDQIDPFSQKNSWCQTIFLKGVSDKLPESLMNEWTINQRLKSLKQVNFILEKDSYDTFQVAEESVGAIQNINLTRAMINSTPKNGFLSNDGFMVVVGQTIMLFESSKKVNKIQLMKDINLYFGIGFDSVQQMKQLLEKKRKSLKQVEQKFAFKMFSKQLYGRFPTGKEGFQKDQAVYGNWDFNFAWRDEIPGRITHNISQLEHKYGPQNFICLLQMSGTFILGVEIVPSDFLY